MADKKMNFVFFFPDELRAESVGCYGHPIVRTPHIDRLAAKGTRFEQCHVQNTVCAPSRCSLMTGLYPHVSGHRTLWHLLRPHEPSLFHYLKNDGYKIKWYGKNHIYSDDALKELMGEEAFQKAGELYGSFKSMTPYDKDDERFYSFLMEPDGVEPVVTETEVKIEKAIKFLESDEAKENPFFLYIPSFMPHAPYVVPEPYYSMYNNERLPELRPANCANKPSYYNEIRAYRNMDNASRDTLEKVQSVYLGMISHVDAAFGRLMGCLDKNGYLDNTTVILASDHGDYAGDYGLVEKWPNGMEDCLTRVPLIIQAPNSKQGHVVKEQVELFDIMATVLELAEVKSEHDHFAVSLVPQLQGASGDQDRVVFAEGGYDEREPHCFEGDPVRDAWFANDPSSIYWPKARQQLEKPYTVCRTVMMRTTNYKLVYRVSDQNELYDLQNDPDELINEYNNPHFEQLKLEMERKLLHWYIHTSDTVPRNNDAGTFLFAQ